MTANIGDFPACKPANTGRSRISAETITRFVEELIAEQPSAEALEWLQSGFSRYLDDADVTLPGALGLDAFSRGLRDAVRSARVRRHIAAAARLLDPSQVMTARSVASVLRSELLRLQRSPGRPVKTGVERHLQMALQAGCPVSITQLRANVAGARADGMPPLQPVDPAVENAPHEP